MTDLPPGAPRNADIFAILQLLEQVVKPVRDDVQSLSGRIDRFTEDIERRYYSREVIDAMVEQRQEQIRQLQKNNDDLKIDLKSLTDKVAGQWDRWLMRLGVIAALAASIVAIVVNIVR